MLLRSYLASGPDAFRALKGLFAAVIKDDRSGEVFAARDPLGIYPLFYADTATGLHLSISIDALLALPAVSSALNRLALADHLSHRWPDVHETYFEAVKRVPAGTLLRRYPSGRIELERYWDPSPPGKPVDWVTEDELGRFDELLEQAVRRRLSLGRVGIYLSGGLDSVTVAALATDESRRLGLEPPEALSLVFEHESANEEELQRRVGVALSLPHTVVPLSKTVGDGGLLRGALAVSARRSAPLLSLWEPCYEYLGLEARRDECRALLTGSGGDEWLDFNPVYAADLMRAGEFDLLWDVWGMMHRSYRLSRLTAGRHVLWTYGLRPIVRQFGARNLRRLAPSARVAHRRRWVDSNTPQWVMPNAFLRKQLLDRHQRLIEADPGGSYYERQVRRTLDSPIVSTELEETFERGRQLGIPILHPFLDADLAAFLYVTPPKLLMRGGRSKGLIRDYVARRFPELGFDRQRKLNANAFFAETLVREGRQLWRELGGAQALAMLGVVDPVGLDSAMERIFSGREPLESFRVWYVLSLEAWTRSRVGLGDERVPTTS
jgi:asparagine synthase (glutamine-hydrolysing)